MTWPWRAAVILAILLVGANTALSALAFLDDDPEPVVVVEPVSIDRIRSIVDVDVSEFTANSDVHSDIEMGWVPVLPALVVDDDGNSEPH